VFGVAIDKDRTFGAPAQNGRLQVRLRQDATRSLAISGAFHREVAEVYCAGRRPGK